jgi:hypothetical protein
MISRDEAEVVGMIERVAGQLKEEEVNRVN